MELESALAAELGRLVDVAGASSRLIAAKRPWWVDALQFLNQVVL